MAESEVRDLVEVEVVKFRYWDIFYPHSFKMENGQRFEAPEQLSACEADGDRVLETPSTLRIEDKDGHYEQINLLHVVKMRYWTADVPRPLPTRIEQETAENAIHEDEDEDEG